MIRLKTAGILIRRKVERENSSKRENLRIKLVKGASFTRRGKIYTKGNPVYAAAEEAERLLNTGFFDRA